MKLLRAVAKTCLSFAIALFVLAALAVNPGPSLADHGGVHEAAFFCTNCLPPNCDPWDISQCWCWWPGQLCTEETASSCYCWPP